MQEVSLEPPSWKLNWNTEPIDYKDATVSSVSGGWARQVDIPEQKVFNGLVFPLTISPSTTSNENATIEDTVRNLENSHEWLDKLLIKHGAVLFRGFPLLSPVDFDKFVSGCGYPHLPYLGGAAVRHVVVGNVFTTNDSPPEVVIPFHHEMAQVVKHPNHLFFHCDVPPTSGGETPIVLSWLVHDLVAERIPDFMAKLEKEGVRYIRNLPKEDDPLSAIGRGWKSTYLSEDKSEVEKNCLKTGATFEWQTINGEEDVLHTVSALLPAVRFDNRSGRKVFFNSMIIAFTGWQDKINDRRKAIVFGDGTPIPSSDIEVIVNILDENKVAFKWHKGDVVVIDNKLAMHARNFFTPPRVILASLTL
eukprot:TRINITY_DN4244_c0_g1_i3.p1 TRINITY_DN4244_c0_g1~~TRINITY_DN4244_c0_g1_i3.p1  ORF type:complete len:362 (-),score=61.69 TRINITY_DN4244_c0_g1_i3:1300-2385(-)